MVPRGYGIGLSAVLLLWAGIVAAQSSAPQVVHIPAGVVRARAGNFTSDPVTLLPAMTPPVASVEFVGANPPYLTVYTISIGRPARVRIRFQQPSVQTEIPLSIGASITGDSGVLTLEPTKDPAVYLSNPFRLVDAKPL